MDDVKKERDHEYVSKLISTYFSQKLFTTVSEIFVRKDDEANQPEEYSSGDSDSEQ